MLKIVVYDGGRGGELFAKHLKEQLPLVEIIPIIDKAHPELLRCGKRKARAIVCEAIASHVGKVDLIVIANHFIAATSLEYFRKKYPGQKFIGFSLPQPDTFVSRPTLVLTTSSLERRLVFKKYVRSLRRELKILSPDQLIPKIDDSSINYCDVRKIIVQRAKIKPDELILVCSHYSALISSLRLAYGRNLKIHDSYAETCHEVYRTLKIRGYYKKRK